MTSKIFSSSSKMYLMIQVTSILGWKEDDEIIYFMATEPGEPGTRHLYSVKPKSNNRFRNQLQIPAECLTCNLLTSLNGSYFISHSQILVNYL